jgi:hypothetical protein
MLYRATIVVCSEIRTKHINILCGHHVEFFNFNPAGIQIDHWAFKVLKCEETGSSEGHTGIRKCFAWMLTKFPVMLISPDVCTCICYSKLHAKFRAALSRTRLHSYVQLAVLRTARDVLLSANYIVCGFHIIGLDFDGFKIGILQ